MKKVLARARHPLSDGSFDINIRFCASDIPSVVQPLFLPIVTVFIMARYSSILWLTLLVLFLWGGISVQGFQSSNLPHFRATSTTASPSQPKSLTWNRPNYNHNIRQRDQVTRLCVLESIQGFFKRFTTKATASHILIKGGAEAGNKLEDIKAELGDSPVTFAEYAALYSECPSASSGGNLGEFGPGAMVPEFDKVSWLWR